MIHNFLTNRIVLQPTRINWHSNILQGDLTITLRKSLVSQYQHIFHVILFVFGFGGTIWRVPILCFSPNIILFLDNKSSYKMVRISSHPLGSFSSPSPSNISHRKITQTRHIKKFMKKLSRCLTQFYQKYVMAFPGFVISPIWHFLSCCRQLHWCSVQEGEENMQIWNPVNPHRTCLPHVQSEILRVFHLCYEEIIILMIFVSENLETRE